MPTFEIWYSETYTYKAWFQAEDKDKAIEMLEKVREGDAGLEELPDFGKKDKNYELDIQPSEVAEI